MRSPGVLVPDTRLIRDLNVGAGGGDNADTGETGTQRHGEVTSAQTLAIYTLVMMTWGHNDTNADSLYIRRDSHWQDMGHGHIDGITTHYFGIVRTITTLD